MLDYRIKTFITVSETLNFTQAAKQLHITQPAVTKHIQALEEHYHTKLVVFDGKRARLTTEGKRFRDLILTINNDIKHFKNHLKQKHIPLHFGATLTIGEYILTEQLTFIISQNPCRPVKMLVENTQTLLKAIDDGQIDFALIEGFFSKEKYNHLLFKQEPFIAVASPNFCHQEPVPLEELLQYPLILREDGSGTRELLRVTLQKQGLDLTDFKQITEIGNLNTIKSLVEHHLGITFVYQSVVKTELKKGSLIKIPLKHPPIIHDLTFIWRKGSQFNTYYQDIFQLFKN